VGNEQECPFLKKIVKLLSIPENSQDFVYHWFMPIPAESVENSLLRQLPSVDLLSNHPELAEIRNEIGEFKLASFARDALDEIRRSVISGESTRPTIRPARVDLVEHAISLIRKLYHEESRSGMNRVINAAGVIVHTNLGRAPLSEAAKHAIIEAAGYSTVEYDVTSGKRGKRGERVEGLICELTGAEAALFVNNCASAAFLVLNTLAKGREVVISRGELVEIGGDFRVPDVLERSGATLREVGTTNRTKISDYEKSIGEETALLMRVHPSNYRIIGFTAAPTTTELASLASKAGIVFFEDAGSGALVDLTEFGLGDEPVIRRSISEGVDIVTFSGDKLLGGPQSGIIAGNEGLVGKIRRNPLYRALRADKLRYAALEATLLAYRRRTHFEEIPVLRMLSMSFEETEGRVAAFISRLKADLPPGNEYSIEQALAASAVGGGAAPGVQPLSSVVAITSTNMSPNALEASLRSLDPPVIARIEDGRLILDLRTVGDNEFETLRDSVVKVLAQ
jgi:L-seryl-tRNA(Ser) seleniumtransferase